MLQQPSIFAAIIFATIDGTDIFYLQYFYYGEHRAFVNTKLAIPATWRDNRKKCVMDTLPPAFVDPAKINEGVDHQLDQACRLIKFVKRIINSRSK